MRARPGFEEPTLARARRASAIASDDVWVVAGAGRARWNGTEWTLPTSMSTDDVRDAWGTADGRVWAVGELGTISRWDGAAWSVVQRHAGRHAGIWASADDDIVVVGQNGGSHWDGSSWTAWSGPPLTAAWGEGPTDVWAVGGAGAISHWDGTAWTTASSPTTEALYSVFGAAADDVWAVGWAGTVVHWNGADWSAIDLGVGVPMTDVWVAARDDVWVGGADGVHRWNGATWSDAPFPGGCVESLSGTTRPTAIVGRGAGDVVVEWDGTAWVDLTPPCLEVDMNLLRVSATGRIWLFGRDGAILEAER